MSEDFHKSIIQYTFKEAPQVQIPSFTGQQNYEWMENNMYKSPIEAMKEYSEAITRQEENAIITQIQETLGVVVDKEELIKALNYDRNQYQKGYEDAKKKYERKWISVSEGLPEREYENYLVSTKEGDVDIGTYDREKGWSMCDANGIYFPQYKGIEIVAWMPLPEAYKESK